METPDHDVTGDHLGDAIQELKQAVDEINRAIEPHLAEKPHSWGANPLFELKLEIHRDLLDMIDYQKELSEGIVSLLQVLAEYASSHKPRPPMPPPPKPRTPILPGSGLPNKPNL